MERNGNAYAPADLPYVSFVKDHNAVSLYIKGFLRTRKLPPKRKSVRRPPQMSSSLSRLMHPLGYRRTTQWDTLETDRLPVYNVLCFKTHINDPSAGSPTETLLRLLLPLDDQVRPSSRNPAQPLSRSGTSPRASLNHPIGSSDGRCVQRAGT